MNRRPVDPAGAAAAALALVLLIVQAVALRGTFGDRAAVALLVLWQVGVLALALLATFARTRRMRASAHALVGVTAVLYGLLTWAFAGVIDLVVAAVAGWGLIRTLIPELAGGR